MLATLELRLCKAWDRSLRATGSAKTAGSSRLCSVIALTHGKAAKAARDKIEAPHMIAVVQIADRRKKSPDRRGSAAGGTNFEDRSYVDSPDVEEDEQEQEEP